MAQVVNEGLLRGINFAALVMDGFDARTLGDSQQALEEAGASLRIISAQLGSVKSAEQGQDNAQIDVHLSFDDADPQVFDCLLLPGGAGHIDQLRRLPAACSFVQQMAQDAKPIAALREGVALLIAANIVNGHKLTGHPDLKDRLVQAGGLWTEQKIVTDDFLVSAQNVEDLPDFIDAMLTLMENRVRQNVQGTRDEGADVGPSS